MKHLSDYKESDIIINSNKKLYNDIDIISSLIDSFLDIGFDDINAYFHIGSRSHDIDGFGEFISDNINQKIQTFNYNISTNYDRIPKGEVENVKREIETFEKRIESITDSRIDSIDIRTNIRYIKSFTRGEHKIEEMVEMCVKIIAINKKSRYSK